MNTFTPAQPGSSSSRSSLSAFSSVAPMKKAWSTQARPAARRNLSFSAASSMVLGVVFGISKKAVTPPMAAPAEPAARSSLCSRPGSRKWTWVSITPGQDGEAGGVETLRRGGRAQGAQGRDSPALDPDIAGLEAVRRRHLAARQNKVEIVWHSRRR